MALLALVVVSLTTGAPSPWFWADAPMPSALRKRRVLCPQSLTPENSSVPLILTVVSLLDVPVTAPVHICALENFDRWISCRLVHVVLVRVTSNPVVPLPAE